MNKRKVSVASLCILAALTALVLASLSCIIIDGDIDFMATNTALEREGYGTQTQIRLEGQATERIHGGTGTALEYERQGIDATLTAIPSPTRGIQGQ